MQITTNHANSLRNVRPRTYHYKYEAANQTGVRASIITKITEKTFLCILQCQWLNRMTKEKTLNNMSYSFLSNYDNEKWYTVNI